MKDLIFISIFLLFLFIMYILYFPSSLVEPMENASSDKESENPLIQIGKNSSTINMLRERIDKINPEKIVDKLNSMEDNIKTNSDNIKTFSDAQDKRTIQNEDENEDEDENENKDEDAAEN